MNKMTKIIELAHALGEEIAKSDEIRALELTKEAFEKDEELSAKMREYETDRFLLGKELAREGSEADKDTIESLKAKIDELSREIGSNVKYIAFSHAQNALNELMASVNAEIKFCITGERPSTCTHDCSTCGGCSH
jgi:cell fate (sporulation/competence/biofilm development) regulator YlbF (YheA/YmcA/DUF963 family)